MQLACPRCGSDNLAGGGPDRRSIPVRCEDCGHTWIRYPETICPRCQREGARSQEPVTDLDAEADLICEACGHTWTRPATASHQQRPPAPEPILLSTDRIEALLRGDEHVSFPIWLDAIDYARSKGRIDLVDGIAERVSADLRGPLRLDKRQAHHVVQSVIAVRLGSLSLDDLEWALPGIADRLDDFVEVLPGEVASQREILDEIRRIIGRGDVAALARTAALLRRLAAPSLALQAAQRALVMEPANEFALSAAAAALVDQQQAQEAIDLLVGGDDDRSLTNPYHLTALARAYRVNGDEDEALDLSQRLFDETPTTDTAYLLLAAAARFGDEANADRARAFLSAHDTGPRPLHTSAMAELELARELMWEGELDTAESILLALQDRTDWWEVPHQLEQVRARQVLRDRRPGQEPAGSEGAT